MVSDYKIIDISQIQKIPSQTEVPVTRGHSTQRSLCANDPCNMDIVKKMETLKGLWEVIGDDKFQKCVDSLFEGDYKEIEKLKQLKKELTELLIRFDTNPQNYTKTDFDHLMKVISQALIHIYKVLEMWGDLRSTDEDVLKIQKFEDRIEWQPQVGTLTAVDMKKQESLPAPTNANEKGIAKVGNLREYIENRLTWITEQDLK